MKRYLTPSEVAKIFSRSGVIKWIRQGKIRTVEINGRWRIPYSEVEKLLSSSGRDRQVAIYARVLSTSQKVYLETQLKALREWIKRTFNDVKVIEVSDVGLRLKEDK
ncbi:MAG: helix-turn-helix domain-containing protein, partial [Caldisphaera sp.]